MFNFLKKKSKKNISNKQELLIHATSLLIHAARIDENYTNNEKQIIRQTIIELGADHSNVDLILKEAEKNEENSNQILDFTKKIKESEHNFKIKIIEALWKVIFSNEDADMYETNLMRRLSGLLYLDNKIVGDLKEKVKKNSKK
jgi:uncharacterized tellurite resistance protein B-like protein